MKSQKLKLEMLKKMTFFFSSAENYWENDFSFKPNCCDDKMVLKEVASENEDDEIDIKDENFNKENRLTVNEKTTNLTTKDGDYEENYNHNINHNCIQRTQYNTAIEKRSISLKTKLSIREIDDIKANNVEGKRTATEGEIKEEKSIYNKKIVELTDNKVSAVWTNNEDTLLMRLCYSKVGKKWKKISEIISNKSPTQCAYRYKKLKKTNIYSKYKDEGDILEEEKVKKYFEKNYDNFGLNEFELAQNMKKKKISPQNTQKTRDRSESNKINSNYNSVIDDCKQSEGFLKLNKPIFENDSLDFNELREYSNNSPNMLQENIVQIHRVYEGNIFFLK